MGVEGHGPGITDAVVLAAGFGERLRPLTIETPKPAIHFLNRPAIHHIFDSLATYGIKRVFVNIHHLPAKIREVLSPYRNSMEICFSHEPEILGTAGVFFNIKDKLSERFFVINGDIFLEPPFALLERSLAGEDREAVFLLKEKGPNDPYTPLKLETDGEISSIGEGNHFFCGVYAASLPFIDPVTIPVKQGLVPVLMAPRILSGKLGGVAFKGSWHDLGSPGTFLEATKASLARMSDNNLNPSAGSRFIRTDRCSSLIAETAEVDPGADLSGFVTISDDCTINGGAVLENAVVLPGTIIAGGAAIKNSIVLGDKILTA